VRWFLRAVVWLSFVVLALLLLFAYQFRFLPYHSVLVVNVHRAALMLDLALLLLLWPKISRGRTQQVPRPRATFWRIVSACGIFLALGVIDSVVIVHKASYVLVLENERLVEPDEDKLAKLAVTLSLRGRDLRFGDFRGADFRKADLSAANLADVDLRDARLDEARLRFADLSRAELDGASLRGADLSGATLDGARDLTRAQLGQACGTDAKLPPDLTLEPCPCQ
jgi:hypothetical protein